MSQSAVVFGDFWCLWWQSLETAVIKIAYTMEWLVLAVKYFTTLLLLLWFCVKSLCILSTLRHHACVQ